MKKNIIDNSCCVVNVADGKYLNGQKRLKQSLINCGYEGSFCFFDEIPKEWPSHDESPMGYKPLAIKYALEKGFDYVLWLDANMVCVRKPLQIFKKIKKNGYYMPCVFAVSFGEWCSDSSLKTFGMSREQALKTVEVHSGFVGISKKNKLALNLLDEWCSYALDKKTFRGIDKNYPLNETNFNNNCIVSKDLRVKGHRHDQSALSFLAYKYKCKLSTLEIRNFQSLNSDGTNHYGKAISFDTEFIQSRDTKTDAFLQMIDRFGNHTGVQKLRFVIFSFAETILRRLKAVYRFFCYKI